MESLKGCKNNGHEGGNEICTAHAHASKGRCVHSATSFESVGIRLSMLH